MEAPTDAEVGRFRENHEFPQPEDVAGLGGLLGVGGQVIGDGRPPRAVRGERDPVDVPDEGPVVQTRRDDLEAAHGEGGGEPVGEGLDGEERIARVGRDAVHLGVDGVEFIDDLARCVTVVPGEGEAGCGAGGNAGKLLG
ncbi:hypothetical protein ACWGH7_18760 [Streptomyces cyaneofuscatus]